MLRSSARERGTVAAALTAAGTTWSDPYDDALHREHPLEIVRTDHKEVRGERIIEGGPLRSTCQKVYASAVSPASARMAVITMRAVRTWRRDVSASRYSSWKRKSAGSARPSAAPASTRRSTAAAGCRGTMPACPSTTRRSRRLGRWQSCRGSPSTAARPRPTAPVLWKPGVVEDQDARSVGRVCAQPPPHPFGVPRRIGQEALKRLIGARITDARERCAHRFPRAVTQEPEHQTFPATSADGRSTRTHWRARRRGTVLNMRCQYKRIHGKI